MCFAITAGDCSNSVVAESFFASPQGRARAERSTQSSIAEWIEIIYNGSLCHSPLGYGTPLEVKRRYREQQLTTQVR